MTRSFGNPKHPDGFRMKMSATQQVFSTYELLENILLLIAAPEIRRARAVRKTWTAIIKRPKSLSFACDLGLVSRSLNVLLCGDTTLAMKDLLTWLCEVAKGTKL